jgi:hypothetical protein
MLGTANEDLVPHDHLVAFVEEGDPFQFWAQYLPEAEDAETHLLEPLVAPREPGGSG